MTGFRTLLYKELLRFWKVSFQTIAAPVLTALLYMLVFSHVLESRVEVKDLRVLEPDLEEAFVRIMGRR